VCKKVFRSYPTLGGYRVSNVRGSKGGYCTPPLFHTLPLSNASTIDDVGRGGVLEAATAQMPTLLPPVLIKPGSGQPQVVWWTPDLHIMFVHVMGRLGGQDIKNHILCFCCVPNSFTLVVEGSSDTSQILGLIPSGSEFLGLD
jgi:hypothetical protein